MRASRNFSGSTQSLHKREAIMKFLYLERNFDVTLHFQNRMKSRDIPLEAVYKAVAVGEPKQYFTRYAIHTILRTEKIVVIVYQRRFRNDRLPMLITCYRIKKDG